MLFVVLVIERGMFLWNIERFMEIGERERFVIEDVLWRSLREGIGGEVGLFIWKLLNNLINIIFK